MKCQNCCSEVPEFKFHWTGAQGYQAVNLCGCCAALVWGKFGQTDAFRSLVIEELELAA